MTWRWLDLTSERPSDAEGSAPVHGADGSDAGFLAWWPKSSERPGRARRVDERIVAGGGTATWISWCCFDPEDGDDASFAFDDGAVSGALRRRLVDPWPEAVSTLLVDWSRVGGSITTGRSALEARIDPFARVFPQRRMLRIRAGVLGPIPPPTGPGITRYGSGNPWPWDRYAGQVS
jgi:hypothetical protein